VRRFLVWCLGLAAATAGYSQTFSIVDMQVKGNQRFSAASVVAGTGLKRGGRVASKDVEAAAQRLAETGMFAEVEYRYDRKTVNRISGYVVTWLVQEAPISAVVRLEFPGIDEEELWRELTGANGLVSREIPANALVVGFLQRNLEAALRKRGRTEPITYRNQADNLTSGSYIVVFRPR
jgi:outer membrane protein assembly factor BamA